MSEEKKAIEILECFEVDDLVEYSIYMNALDTIKNYIEKLQKENEKQEQVIDEMAEFISVTKEIKKLEENWQELRSIVEIKQYFYRKVEENE